MHRHVIVLMSLIFILFNVSSSEAIAPLVPRGIIGDGWADVVLGKPDFNSLAPNEVTGARVFNGGGVTVDRSVQPNRLYVYDGGNSRVLGLSHLGTCSGGSNAGQVCTTNSNCPQSSCDIEEGRSADLVIGQPDFSSSGCNGDSNFQNYPTRAPASASSLCGMTEKQVSPLEGGSIANMAVDEAGNLYVPDWDNHRILLYIRPFETDTVADLVWGQDNFSDNDCNEGRGVYHPDQDSICLRSPFDEGFVGGVGLDKQKNLWVTDNQNNRTLRFPFDPSTRLPSHTADLVLGQANFTTGFQGTGLNQMFAPAAVRVDDRGSVYVADSLNNRVLIFDPPLRSGMKATRLLGGDLTLREPTSLEFDLDGNIWVSDRMNSQLLRFNQDGKVDRVLFKDIPDYSGVCGGTYRGDEPDFYFPGSQMYMHSYNVCDAPGSIGIDSDGNIFVYALSSWQDVWRFPAPFPLPQRGVAHSADKQIFKPYAIGEFNHVSINALMSPRGVAVSNGQIIVADTGRILFWNTKPSELANGQPADGYVGAPGSSMQKEPHFGKVDVDGLGHLYAIHGEIIEVYDLPLSTGDQPFLKISNPLSALDSGMISMQLTRKAGEITQNAGHGSAFSTSGTNWGWNLHTGDIAVTQDAKFLWISDSENSRVLRVRDPLTRPVVDIVLGQNDLASDQCNQGMILPTAKTLCYPGHISLDASGNLYVTDHSLEVRGNFRLLRFDANLFPDLPTQMVFGISASRVYGPTKSFTQGYCISEYCGPWEAAFDLYGRMYLGFNGYTGSPFPHYYEDPQNELFPSGRLNDYFSMAFSTFVDQENNLYIGDLNRGRVLIYFLGDPKQSYTITGKIINGKGEPLDQVKLTMKPSLWSWSSTKEGTFTITASASQKYELIPTKDGCTFSPSSRSISILGETPGLDFTGCCISDFAIYIPFVGR